MSIGETLAVARREAGLTVDQVSERTRIRAAVVRAIEHDDFAPCGGDFYARGHIRSIAKVVGADPGPLIEEYDAAHGSPQPVSAVAAFEPEMPVKIRERRSPNWSAAMAAALVLVLLYGVVRAISGAQDPQTARPVAVPTEVRPGTAAPATPRPPDRDAVAAVPEKPRRDDTVEVLVRAKRSSWLNVRDDKGKQLFSGLLAKGETMQWSARKQIRILIGNGGGVELTVNGKNLGVPGTDGQVLRLSFGPDDPDGA
ncbi:helix-turn-helix domain-containing protein [Thermomonospora cellulosilytica]|uniref:Cytoskeletal protein RodZ n=1 Tax=Thermomonospora cellulosilytica TaxID=1411118 RepID=A0A7W3N3P8_9ACTN|nr:helix-turn-helix domain-containing protein [Thermomonospora cellulosilytica]MBA9006969.1 cytoskeletal protein RodZ [Thermomonospora cellulosilytica]